MTTRRKTGARLGMLPLTVMVLLTAGCGTQRAGKTADAYRRSHPTPTGISTPSTQADFTCPGESPKPTAPPAAHTPTSTLPPTDHYAENHGYQVPIPLHGQNRCDGLTAVGRVEKALEPLRRRGDFAPDSVRNALTNLGYSAGKVQAYQDGSAGVGFLIDIGVSPWCVEGTMSGESTKADAFGGYPDGTNCQPPSGGH
ncbi:hypothetical protein [Streptomyces olivochromogenes]|uniref:hypothetical protein n=1 Tax=Streptomyces olivochromogenes TaxID=1963 RepID=UPI001F1B66B4|nr:hypothetical protein [Streptomyces olivochromogenes]MCF3135055.1 hypothetical protein [Streptomyces olivochromogenes]